MNSPFRKKSVAEIDTALLSEPHLSAEDWRAYEEGWRLFNDQEFWEAHEAWEAVWKRRPEESRIFFQGIIQVAAAYHLLLVKKRFGGTMRNFEKAEEKLKLFPKKFLCVNVESLLDAIESARQEIERLGVKQLEMFDTRLIPKVIITQQ